MKKFTFTKIALLIFFSASMISCAGDPEPQPEPVQELQDDAEAENLQADFTAPIEEPAVFESETESVAESPNLEPIDDEEGFYMSDKTVLENTDSSEDTEAAEEDSEGRHCPAVHRCQKKGPDPLCLYRGPDFLL